MNGYDYKSTTCPDCGVKPGVKCQGSRGCYEILHNARRWKSMYLQSQAKLERQRDVISDLLEERKC